jgi:hypothetical protein
LLDVSRQAQIDHPAIGNPVMRGDPGANQDKKDSGSNKYEAEARYPPAPADANAQRVSPFRRDKDPGGKKRQ